jgi:Ca-activated chloride channel homolog
MHFQYIKWDERFAKDANRSAFDRLFDVFQQLLTIAGGDVAQALRWLTDLDKQYGLIDGEYSMGDFIQDLQDRRYIEFDEVQSVFVPTPKTGRTLRQRSLEEIFRGLKKGFDGSHKSVYQGRGTDREPETRNWQFGDDTTNIESVGTIMNTLRHSDIERFQLTEDDLLVNEMDYHTSVATVLMIDLSHSMILYGEDRITPAKKVAMAMAELILSRFTKDSLDIIAFGNDAWRVSIEDLPWLNVGPYHTNTLAGLELARHTLQRRKNANKQIFMITDGKPSAMFENGRLYKNSFGLDRKIVNKVLDEAVKCRREKIPVTTFMIATDPYLQNFVRELTEANNGRAYFASLDNLGGYIFEDYIRNRRKKVN